MPNKASNRGHSKQILQVVCPTTELLNKGKKNNVLIVIKLGNKVSLFLVNQFSSHIREFCVF